MIEVCITAKATLSVHDRTFVLLCTSWKREGGMEMVPEKQFKKSMGKTFFTKKKTKKQL